MDVLASQRGWAAGIVRDVPRDRIGASGMYDATDVLLDDEGDVYLRGPTARLAASAFGAGLTGVWDVSTAAGRRTLLTAATWAVLSGTTPVDLLVAPPSKFMPVGVAGDFVLLPPIGTTGFYTLYAGATKPSYGAGNVDVVKDSGDVVGHGTSWATTVTPGHIFHLGGAFSTTNPPYVVKEVVSNTALKLTSPYREASALAGAYSLDALSSAFMTGPVITDGPIAAVCGVSGRFLIAVGSRVRVSAGYDPVGLRAQPWHFGNEDDVHDMPGAVIAMAQVRDRAIVFTEAGVYAIDGIAYDIVDAYGNPGRRVSRISGDVVARNAASVTTYRDGLLIAAVDGIYLMDAGGSLELISRSIGPLWHSLVASGVAPGLMATFRDHALIPLSGQQTLVARLDRRINSATGRSCPWTRIVSAEASDATAFAVKDPAGSAKLIAGTDDNGWVLDASGLFNSVTSATGAIDANGEDYQGVVTTRSFVLAGGALAFVRDVLLEYLSGRGLVSVTAYKDEGASSSALGSADTNLTTGAIRALAVRLEARKLWFDIKLAPVYLGGGVGAGIGTRLRSFALRGRLRGRAR